MTCGEILNFMRYLLIAVATLLLRPVLAADPVSASDQEFAAAFRCPETLADDAERNRANEQFSAWIHAHHANWTLQQILQFRASLLSGHNCQTALTRVPEPADAGH
jgi:hypothetical protein